MVYHSFAHELYTVNNTIKVQEVFIMNMTPLYKRNAEYAREHGELEIYRSSMKANIACKEAIEAAIRGHFDGMHLDKVAVSDVIEAYGLERTCYVVANSVQQKTWDGRFSNDNKEWARQFEITGTGRPDDDRRFQFLVDSHPAVFDGFIHELRREYLVKKAPRQDKSSLYTSMRKACSQVKPRLQIQAKPAKQKEPER